MTQHHAHANNRVPTRYSALAVYVFAEQLREIQAAVESGVLSQPDLDEAREAIASLEGDIDQLATSPWTRKGAIR